MKKGKIFLSYRRDDSPGYVSRLEGELERAFGEGRVFRDATDIAGGTKWKQVIEENLRDSAVLLLIVGPRWEQIWEARRDDEVNYIALELQRADELGVPIIPVTLDGVQLSRNLDLGGVDFIRENQFHDISDKQGRWGGDFARLVRLLEGIDGVGVARNPGKDAASPEEKGGGRSAFGWIAGALGLSAVAVVWIAGAPESGEPEESRASRPARDTVATRAQDDKPVPGAAAPLAPVPLVGGTWRGQDGTVYHVEQYDDGTFAIESPGYASGRGRFLDNMPRKAEVEMFGIGRGEFSVSAGDDKIMGWIEVDGRQEYDTLMRIR